MGEGCEYKEIAKFVLGDDGIILYSNYHGYMNLYMCYNSYNCTRKKSISLMIIKNNNGKKYISDQTFKLSC